MPVTVTRRRRPLQNLERHASTYAGSAGPPPEPEPIDRSRWFVSPELTPLYYTAIYRELSEPQQRRYNQLTAMCFNELIALFEEVFAQTLLAAIHLARGRDDRLARCLEQFLEDEREHIEHWRGLNRRVEPVWYGRRDHVIARVPAPARWLLMAMAKRPRLLPASFWLMLAMEEHSIEISRRCLHLNAQRAEPSFRAAYHHHATDEVRHVHLDWHLIDRFYAKLPGPWRRTNAEIVARLIGWCFLPPTRAAVRVGELLVREYPELRPLAKPMRRQLRALARDPDYHAMMYSRSATPILFQLFDHFPEMRRRMPRVLLSYVPPSR